MNLTKIEKQERVLLVGIELQFDNINIEESLDELEELVYAAGGIVISRVIQRRSNIDVTYFIGKGKVEEIKNFSEELNIDTIVFNNELSGAQIRNLEKVLDKKIVDRTNLILDIFANRAKSKEGILQVKLAQLKYRLPRLIGYRDYLSREGGGIGTRGPGEQKLELDRRVIQKDISKIEKELKEVKKTRDIKRNKRNSSNIPIVSIVGYTNAGKSTLLNKIIERNENHDENKKVYAYDMLFATLDTSLREARLLNGHSFLITDTVGFVDKLPTNLIEAFKGTLEEVNYSDLILHVVDISNTNVDMQISVTNSILEELKVMDKPIITVFNKVDKEYDEDILLGIKNILNPVYVSAVTGEGIEELLLKIEEELPHKFNKVSLLIPFSDQELVDYFLKNYNPDKVEYREDGTEIEILISEVDYRKYNKFIIGDNIES